MGDAGSHYKKPLLHRMGSLPSGWRKLPLSLPHKTAACHVSDGAVWGGWYVTSSHTYFNLPRLAWLV